MHRIEHAGPITNNDRRHYCQVIGIVYESLSYSKTVARLLFFGPLLIRS